MVNKVWTYKQIKDKLEWIVQRLWAFNCGDHKKLFLWKILMGAISYGVEAATKDLGSEICGGVS